MNFREFLKHETVYLDGAMGTLLQAAGLRAGEYPERLNLSAPETIREIHKAYFDAGSNVVLTNTFGANALKFEESELEEIIKTALENAKDARASSSGTQEKFIALDIGPTGKLLKPLGDLDFDRAVDIFKKTVALGIKYSPDLIFIETMNDSYETKAAVLAVRELTDLPLIVTNAYGDDGKLMTGASPEAMCAMLEGMGVDALGANCSLGPDGLLPTLERLLAVSSIPVVMKPNAGLPKIKDGATVYDVRPEDFAHILSLMAKKGCRVMGGCCGTTPQFISELCKATAGIDAAEITDKKLSVISSYTHAVSFGKRPILIGERINPTGKKPFREAIKSCDMDYILTEGICQEEKGADVLDVNVGLPEIDEAAFLSRTVRELQAVTSLPLEIDTSDHAALEKALRYYNGKAMINSVNGKRESMEAVFPLVKKYGGLVVALTLDEEGIPEDAEGRVKIAKKIIEHAERYGIKKNDLIFDPLTLTVSAAPRAASVTLEAVRRIKQELGANTSLGVSNVSFGLPNRDMINSTFFALALEAGLDAAIMNPHSAEMMKTYYSYCALKGHDAGFKNYIERSDTFACISSTTVNNTAEKTQHEFESELQYAIVKGLQDRALAEAEKMIKEYSALDIISSHIIPALNYVGDEFEKKNLYLPSLLMSAECAKSVFDKIKLSAKSKSEETKGEPFVLATVKGDIHDIGKNIVKLLLENYGYDVIDLGRDVAPEAVLDAVHKTGARLVGLSALMTTTTPAMAATVKLLKQEKPNVRIIVGGAVLTEEYAKKTGADAYAEDAMETVRIADKFTK